jgi:ABC-type bacteriocin/lantibiotic exporter with double-glycine peptidase domain
MAKALRSRPKEESKTSVIMTTVSAEWTKLQEADTLKCVSLSIKRGQFCAIVGPVGSGKVLHVPCLPGYILYTAVQYIS